jgi:hypothetical protein
MWVDAMLGARAAFHIDDTIGAMGTLKSLVLEVGAEVTGEAFCAFTIFFWILHNPLFKT